ncbi:MAG: hypothetical protein KIT22_13420 [Verrucomicrobiae bacterium]|nr:hypothetical protein [Verrucomicrobiae bacterium]
MTIPTLTPIANRAGSDTGWYHLVPKGEFPHPDTGLLQVLDDEAITAMANRFAAEAASPNFGGLLVDQEHWSLDPDRSSEAYGWVRAVENRADGLWGRIEWTDLGTHALETKRYKFASPVWMPNQVQRLGNRRIRPMRLDSAGLTNNPNLRGMVPLTNRAGAEPADIETQPLDKPQHMKSVAAALGLAPEASEEAVLAAVTALKQKAEAAEGALKPVQNRVTTLEGELTTLRDAQITEDLKPLANRAKPEVIESFRSSLKADRTAALPGLQAFIGSLSAAKPSHQPLTNRRTAGHPDAVSGEANPDDRADAQEAEIQRIRIANRCTYRDAAQMARRTKPELFDAAADAATRN